MSAPLTFDQAYEELRQRGVILKHGPAQYQLHYHGDPEPRRITDDLDEALEMGREMIAFAKKKEPPLGPMGRRSRRGDIYRHNRKLAKRRGYI